MNRILSIVLTLMLAFAFLPAMAQSDDSELTDGELQQIIEQFAEEEDAIDPSEIIQVSAEDLSVTPGLDEKWINILLLGTDDRTNSMNARTDSIIVLSINQETAQVKMTSFMRDIWVSIPGKGQNKLNAANVYGGPNLVMKTINENFGLNIEKYVMINMNGLVNVIDAVGGLDLPISKGERKWINYYLEDYRANNQGALGANNLESYGENTHLTGAQATAYCRIRYIGNDQQRTERQRSVIMQLARKMKEAQAWTLVTMLPQCFNFISTNYTLTEAVQLGGLAMKTDLDGVEQARVPFDNTYKSGTYGKVWSIRPDFEENTQKLYEFIYGS